MTEITKLPFSGVECNRLEQVCKAWWGATINEVFVSAEVKIPMELENEEAVKVQEIHIEDILGNSHVDIEGVEECNPCGRYRRRR